MEDKEFTHKQRTAQKMKLIPWQVGKYAKGYFLCLIPNFVSMPVKQSFTNTDI